MVEETHNKQGELAFKTMYFENGKYINNDTYQRMLRENGVGSNPLNEPEAHRVASADKEIIPQNAKQSQVNLNKTSEPSDDIAEWHNELKAKQQKGFDEREKSVGKTGIEARADTIEIGESIPTKPVEKEAIEIYDVKVMKKPLNVENVVVKKSDLKERFEKGGLQPRTKYDGVMVEKAIKDFSPDEMLKPQGTFEGIPVITKDGQVLAGNHRTKF